jgi:preprotein translocase subunit YajC
MNGEFLIPIILFGATAWVLIVYFNNRSKERMAMIEKGVNPIDFKGTPVKEWFRTNPLSSLKWGLLSAFVGLGLMVGMYLHRNLDTENSVYLACMLISGGLALVIFYFIASKQLKQEQR